MMFKKKNFLFLILSVFLLAELFAAVNSYAHTPWGMSIAKDISNEMIFIDIKHRTRIPYFLYIEKVEVFVDEQAPMVFTFSRQKRKSFQPMEINIPGLKDTKKIGIKAYPRRGKVLEKEFLMRDVEARSKE